MKKLLIIGNSPMPEDLSESRPAAGIRSYQFLKSAKESGLFEIKAVAIDMGGLTKAFDESVVQVGKEDFSKVQSVCDEFKPDLILGVNTYPSYVACGLKTDAPIWADLNGWIMAEAQAQAYKMNSDSYIPHYFEFEKRILTRADKFSAVSKPEEYALLGSLAWAGRLNAGNFGKELVCTIQNGTEDFLSDKSVGTGLGIDTTKFNVLWLGGYNTWVDEELLFRGVDSAMNECPELCFVSTGGGIEGLDNKTFERFKSFVDASKNKDRYKFLGWVKTEEIPSIYRACSVGLNIDRMCVETITGARNRINEMMKFGLPVLTTFGSEIAGECVKVGAGMGVKNEAEFKDAIVSMFKLWKEGGSGLKDMGAKGRQYILSECSFTAVCKPFLSWDGVRTAGPCDLGGGALGGVLSSANVKAGLQYLKQNGAKQFAGKLFSKIMKK